MKTELQLFDHSLTLHRYPHMTNETLQAWDAGDEYLIHHCQTQPLPDGQNILILNDNFGALAAWFSRRHHVTVVSDSFISTQGIQANLAANQCPSITLLTSNDELPSKIDLVLMQIPKNNRYLTWQLHQLRQVLSADVPVIAVNKARDIHTSTLKLFEKHLGETTTSLAWKKHRLVFCQANAPAVPAVEPFTTWRVDAHQMELSNLPNVYSGESLDLGARFMLEHIPAGEQLEHIIDLGCGNGVLSVKAAQANPNARFTLVDESFMALASAKLNLERNGTDTIKAHYVANNCLDGFERNQADLILCNPPFHQQQAVTDHIAWQMFCDAQKVLKSGGMLQVIGNRHLGYDAKLKRLFGQKNVKLLSSNSKFVILQATKG